VNIKEYISSGILEAYALGELNAGERAAVEKNLVRYPELRQELAQIEEAQEKLLMEAAVPPPAVAKEKLFQKIDADPTENIVPFRAAPRPGAWKLAAAASITVALITSYLAYDYRTKWRSTATDLSTLIAQNQRIAQDYGQVNQRLDRIENDMRVMDNPEFKRVVMKGTGNAPEALASVYWNESSQEVYLSIQRMKALARENQYQLWAIIDGKPVDAGVFDGATSGLIKMKHIGKGATTFAVTIEPKGWKPFPTLETMQVAGNVDKG
jgi:anti-sigma-K factor RskA